MKTLKPSLFIILLSGLQLSSFAQKPDKEALIIYEYTQLPSNPLPENYKAFILEVNAFNDDPSHRDKIYASFNFEGFEKKRSGDSDFKISIDEYPFTYSGGRKSKENTVKKDGVEKKVISYYYQYSVEYKLSARMLDKNEEELFSTMADMSQSGSTKDYADYKKAADEYNRSIDNIRVNVQVRGAKKLSEAFNEKFGYPLKSKNLVIFNVKAKKLNYDDFEEAYSIALNAAAIVKENENDIDKCFEAYKPAIEIWKKALEESNIDDKKARVNLDVTCACYYNLGNAYLLCKYYDEAIESFEKVLEIDKKFSNADVLLDFAKDRRSRAIANQ